MKASDYVYVSPEDEESFVDTLQAINPISNIAVNDPYRDWQQMECGKWIGYVLFKAEFNGIMGHLSHRMSIINCNFA